MSAEPRVPPLPESEWSDDQRALVELNVAGGPGGKAVNIYHTLVRFPGLLRRLTPWGAKLQLGKIGARDRELLILRTAWNCQSDYEWGQHVYVSKQLGLTADEIARIPAGPDHPGWAPFDATLLRAADELHAHARIADATWAELVAHYDERQLIELPFLVGNYHMFAFALNTFGVQLEAGFERLPEPPR
jgi:4-carboxymuconolactone decarboxylase